MSDINPLFVIEAEQLLLDNKYDDSINLCNQGLIEYPEYITAWGILVQAYRKKGDIDNAKSTLEKVLNEFPENKFLNSLKDTVFTENIDKIAEDNSEQKNVDLKDIDNSSDEIQIRESDQEMEFIEETETSDTAEQEISDEKSSPQDIQIDGKTESEEIIETENISDNAVENNQDNELFTDKDDLLTDDIEIDANKTNESLKETKTYSESLESDEEKTVISIDENEIIEKSYKSFINNLTTNNKNTSLNKISEQLDIIPGLDEIDFINENILSIERSSFKLFNEIPNFSEIKINFQKENSKQEKILAQISDDLTKLASELETATIPKVKENEEEDKENGNIESAPIVSETMAKIYVHQGAYEQAAQAYRELIKENPEKKEYFTEKLNEIISKL